jgi:hypothetical protein
MRFAWLLSLASGCVFGVQGLQVEVGGGDGGGDQQDLAGPPDDLGTQQDLLAPDDPPPPDLMPPVIQLSHVPQHWLGDGTCDLTVASSIDTTNLKIDNATPPSGCVFQHDTEAGSLTVAVLAVHSLTTSATVTVSGNQPLVIVAGTTITIGGLLDGSATAATAGPGGYAAALGPGAGSKGVHADPYSDAGGGGGSYGSTGGVGGTGSYQMVTIGPGPASATYAIGSSVPGGSGGGSGTSEMCNSGNGGAGGAGGGSIQLSAGGTILINGAINVGGGAGGGGCQPSAVDQGSGGGGGSGGAIFLEAPVVTVTGGLWANGGSGGGGGSGSSNTGPGSPGNDGTQSQAGAVGGAGGGTYGGAGGAGSAIANPVKGSDSANGGGGGGGAGRIVVRSHGAAAINSSTVSPAATLDPTVP